MGKRKGKNERKTRREGRERKAKKAKVTGRSRMPRCANDETHGAKASVMAD
jgi:hypothetical protein